MSYININQTIEFLYGEGYNHEIVPYEEIESLCPSVPGIYCWYLRIKDGQEYQLEKIGNTIFRHLTVKAEVTSNIRLKYVGILNKENYIEKCSNNKLLRQLFVAFRYPLYIGMSLNINRRLIQHKDSLEKCLVNRKFVFTDDNYSFKTTESDSDNESKCFGERFARAFLDFDSFPKDSLYVSYIRYPSDTIKEDMNKDKKLARKVASELRQAETIANTLFNPIFGRR